MSLRPRSSKQIRTALRHALSALGADWSIETIWPLLAANLARFRARDYLLDRQPDLTVLERFEVRGYDRLGVALARGTGAILVGSHLGAHIAGVHWLYRRGVPLRLLVQRPRHVSGELDRRFDVGGAHSQAEMFLRRDMSPSVAVERLFRARAALREGLAVYLNGDIPWTGPNTCTGSLLGRRQRLLAIWTELAVLTGAPVFFVFCTHQPRGRFVLELEEIGRLRPGDEVAAVSHYLRQLEARIAMRPADAVAYLTWPCYQAPPAALSGTSERIAHDREASWSACRNGSAPQPNLSRSVR
jgi:lauroyl/myristoyl acyltransferase